MEEWHRWATYRGDGDRMIDHDSGYTTAQAALADARAAMEKDKTATLAYVEVTDGNQSEFLFTLRRDAKTGNIVQA